MNKLTEIENETSMISIDLGDKNTIIHTSKIIFDSIITDLEKKNLLSNLKLKWGNKKKKHVLESAFAKTSSQYSKAVFWYGFDFSGVDDKDVKGIIIKPYCIISDNVNKAVKKCSCHKFNEQGLDFVDIDDKSFNIHKYPSLSGMRFQVVLAGKNISPSGPGRDETTKSIDFFGKDTTPEEKRSCIKTDWYFPAIQESVETCDIRGCLADSESENLLEKKPIKRLEYLLAVDIVKAMQTVLTDDSFNKYLANIKLEELCELEREANTFFLKLDAKREALAK